MAEFRLPDLGENIESGEVINVLVAEGDSLSQDQPVIELETDKAVIEVPSTVSGTVSKIMVSKGDKAEVGQVLLTVDGDDAAGNAEAEAEDGSAAEAGDGNGAAVSDGGDDNDDEAPETHDGDAASDDGGDSDDEAHDAHDGDAAGDSGPVEATLPELGEGIDSGDVVSILVSTGDTVEAEQALIELEIDKGVVEMPSPVAGTVKQIHVSQGDRASVGQLIVTLEGAAPASKAPGPKSATSKSAAPKSAAPAAGQKTEPAPSTPAKPAPEPASRGDEARGSAPADLPASRLVAAAPSVRRLAREIGIDIGAVKGTGPGDRVSEDDVKAHARQQNQRRSTTGGGAAAPAIDLPDFARWGEVEREPFSNVRRITAQRMAASWATIPHVTQFDEADVTELEAWRKVFGKQVEKAGAKLTPTAIIIKVAAAALRKFPQFNASIDVAGEEVIYKKYCHIGVAVDTKRGLLVPVIRDVDQKSVTDISVELGEMAEKTRTGKVAVEDMQGGSFTVSNLGGIGGTAFTPIVNAPEVAILGVARGKVQPVYVDGDLQPRTIMPLSLSYDHRLIDGADGARFLRFICEGLANPYFLAFS